MKKRYGPDLGRLDAEAYQQVDKMPLVVVLDHIRSALNVGSIFRTADAFRVAEIHLCGITAAPPHREILKTALGATETVAWTYWPDTADCLRALKEKGFHLSGVEQTDQSISLQDWDWDGRVPTAVVFGNEVGGLAEELLPLLDDCLEIPQFGTKHSLNVAVCAGLVIWEAGRRTFFI